MIKHTIALLLHLVNLSCTQNSNLPKNPYSLAFSEQFESISKNLEIDIKLTEFDSSYISKGLESLVYFTSVSETDVQNEKVTNYTDNALQIDLGSLNERFNYRIEKRFQLNILVSKPIVINDSSILILAQFRYNKGGSEAFYLLKKDQENWKLEKRFNYLEY